MALLIDEARWAAHGTRFAHLASDTSLAELHAFAAASGLSCRGFDHDHYDIPADRVDALIDAGAVRTSTREIIARLDAAGLRVRGRARTPKRARAIARLERDWHHLLPGAPEVGARLLERWTQPHRRYHDVRHLAQMLDALTVLCDGPPPRVVALAAWFHDAVYDGVPGEDERASAELAVAELTAARLPSGEVREVSRLVELTAGHDPGPSDATGVLVSDADLSILGQPAGRYQVYVRDVRLEHPDMSDVAFGMARMRVVEALLKVETLYGSDPGSRLWLGKARDNLTSELVHWQRLGRLQAGFR